MGRKSNTETISAILQAFLRRRSWTQAELARQLDITVPALRKRLHELEEAGLPLLRDVDHPHIWWSVPKDWFPGAVAFGADDIGELLRQLGRLPRSLARDRFIQRIIQAAPRSSALPQGVSSAVVAPTVTEIEERYLPVVEDAAMQRQPLAFKYFTASRGSVEWRHASVQRVTIGPPPRFLATCHRDGTLKWFRIENVLEARLDAHQDFRPADPAAVDAVFKESLDGFHHGAAPVRCSFVVREPDARWVVANLPGPMEVETVPEGRRFTSSTAGVLRLARFVVGVGGAARIETPELAAVARELARGAFESVEAATTSLNDQSVSSNSTRG